MADLPDDEPVPQHAQKEEGGMFEAVVGVDLDYETVGGNASMLMVTVSGTAVVLQ